MESLTFAQTISMAGFLFDEMIFGPVNSRRLGISLGINLLPTHGKFCTFNCIYCECGWTSNRNGLHMQLPTRADISQRLRQTLGELIGTTRQPDSITFAGNGEPTMHPEFAEIIADTISLRNELLPSAKISVLTNGSMLHKPTIFQALCRIDNNIQKLDGGTEETIRLINMPLKAFRIREYVETLKRFNGNLVIQSLFLRGEINHKKVDNTTEKELKAWLSLVLEIRPKAVMVYAIERETPLEGLVRIDEAALERIAAMVRKAGIEAEVYA